MNLLEVGMHVNANLVHEKRVSCCLVADSDELFEHCRRSLLVVGPGCTAGIVQEGEYLSKDEGVTTEQIHVQAVFSFLEDLKALCGRELSLGVLKEVRVGVVLDQNGIRRHRHLDLLKIVLRAGAYLDDCIWKRVECFDGVIDVETGHGLDVLVAVESRANIGSRQVLLLRERLRGLDACLGDCS